MRVPTPREIVELVERGLSAGSGRRALLALSLAFPDVDAGEIADASLSHRDRALLELRERIFGPDLRIHDSCDSCAESLELILQAASIGLEPAPDPFPRAPSSTLGDGGQVRAVNGGDIAAVETAASAEAARAALIARVSPESGETPDLDPTLEALDSAADVQVALTCPGCSNSTLRSFDAPAFVWSELETRARRLLTDVADLARAFHWSEDEILSMPSGRRAFYLDEARA